MTLIRRLAGPFFVFAGVMHFAIPKTYAAIVPDYLPAHRELVYASGVAEIAGGARADVPGRQGPALGRLVADRDPDRRVPGQCPHGAEPRALRQGAAGGRASLIARLPFQLVFIGWVRAAMRSS